MCSRLSAHVVDWAPLVKHHDRRRGQRGWFLEAVAQAEPWMEPWWALPLQPRWCPNRQVWSDARQAYDDLREHLDEATRALFDRFFDVFFRGSDGSHSKVADLDVSELAEATFALALSPATVAEYAQLASALPLETLRTAYKGGFEFDYLPEYVQQWVALLRYAADRTKGVVIILLFNSVQPS